LMQLVLVVRLQWGAYGLIGPPQQLAKMWC
jgi:hypothetical protein